MGERTSDPDQPPLGTENASPAPILAVERAAGGWCLATACPRRGPPNDTTPSGHPYFMCAFHQAERHAAATFAEATRRPNAVATWILEHGAAFHASWIAAHQEDADVPRSV